MTNLLLKKAKSILLNGGNINDWYRYTNSIDTYGTDVDAIWDEALRSLDCPAFVGSREYFW